jgi:hypothetical protein
MSAPVAPSVRLLPFRDRQALIAREADLVAAIADVEEEQQRLGLELIRLRRELSSVHEILWPSSVGHAYRKVRRPRVPGPAPIPRPLPGALPLSGRPLRRAVLAILLRANTPLTLTEIHGALRRDGYELASQHPVKQLANALGYEASRGRARRTARGTYRIGTLSPYRRRLASA